jgi:hypothetical protein
VARPWDLVFDAWTPLSHKTAVAERSSEGRAGLAPTWVGDHARRLNAYILLAAYHDNIARHFLDVDSEADRHKRREYGDAGLLVARVVDALLGEDQSISVEGAAEFDPALPADATPDERAANAAAAAAAEREQWLRDWADDERLVLAMLETEEDAVSLGDGVYVIGLSHAKRRPTLHIYDPGFYFPRLSDVTDGFPPRVDLAWELEGEGDAAGQRLVHRITYELRPIAAPPGQAAPAGAAPTRRYPWQAPGEDASAVTCYMTEGVWALSDLQGRTVHDFPPERGAYSLNDEGLEVRDLDLGIDFIPVVHEPNTPSRKQHYGRSLLALVVQLLDELHAADTDAAAASATTGTPPLAIEDAGAMPTTGRRRDGGDVPAIPTYGPGTVLSGKVTVVDTSQSLDAVLKYVDHLLERLAVNSQVPAEALGRVQDGHALAESGFARSLKFAALQGLVRRMRLVRGEKLPLLLKFVQRMAQAGGYLPPGANPRAEVTLGSFLPTDRRAVIDEVVALLSASPPAISRRTGVEMLVAGGVVDVDVAEELERMEHEDFANAVHLADATGSPQAAAAHLGIDPSLLRAAPAPPPVIPLVPPGQPAPPPAGQ